MLALSDTTITAISGYGYNPVIAVTLVGPNFVQDYNFIKWKHFYR